MDGRERAGGRGRRPHSLPPATLYTQPPGASVGGVSCTSGGGLAVICDRCVTAGGSMDALSLGVSLTGPAAAHDHAIPSRDTLSS